MANNYPDGGEQPLGPIERRVLPWLAWLFTAALACSLIMFLLVRFQVSSAPVAALAGLAMGGVLAAWMLRPWAS